MTPSELSSTLGRVCDILLRADAIVEKEKAGFSVSNKANQFDLLTTVDLAVERFLKAEIQTFFPTDAILAEESATTSIDYTRRVWMIDPIDGTWPFANNHPGYVIVIGLCENGVPTMGAVYAPALKELFYGEKGKGSFVFRNGVHTRLHATETRELAQANMLLYLETGERRPLDDFLSQFSVASKKYDGGMSLRICRIAEGKSDFTIEPNVRASKWDSCAGQVILGEAGGKITDLNGNPLNYFQKEWTWQTNVVTTNGAILPTVIDYIRTHRKK